MNNIRQIQALNKRELENVVSPEGSWHQDYRDTSWVYIGGLPFDLSEGDIITIFSQFGEPVHLNLVRDKETGKSRGFAFLKYEDQRSTDLAVDNLGGATVLGRVLRVDHTRYKPKDDEVIGDNTAVGEVDGARKRRRTGEESESEEEGGGGRGKTQMLQEEKELVRLMNEHDDDDPMKEYLVKEQREIVERALAKLKREKPREKNSREDNSKNRRALFTTLCQTKKIGGVKTIIIIIIIDDGGEASLRLRKKTWASGDTAVTIEPVGKRQDTKTPVQRIIGAPTLLKKGPMTAGVLSPHPGIIGEDILTTRTMNASVVEAMDVERMKLIELRGGVPDNDGWRCHWGPSGESCVLQ
ncbi:MAG: hypothetical protein M1816_001434 [Peltula sp. TS41687]|nr:MAG: hypothetical protein M1816_001434 [Peltula sp. TS41687]